MIRSFPGTTTHLAIMLCMATFIPAANARCQDGTFFSDGMTELPKKQNLTSLELEGDLAAAAVVLQSKFPKYRFIPNEPTGTIFATVPFNDPEVSKFVADYNMMVRDRKRDEAKAEAKQREVAATIDKQRQLSTIFRLKHADADTVAALLNDLKLPDVRIGVDPQTRTIVAAGPRDEILDIQALVLSFDVPVEAKADKVSAFGEQIVDLAQMLAPLKAERDALIAELGRNHPLVRVTEKKIEGLRMRSLELQQKATKRGEDGIAKVGNINNPSLSSPLQQKASQLIDAEARRLANELQTLTGAAADDEQANPKHQEKVQAKRTELQSLLEKAFRQRLESQLQQLDNTQRLLDITRERLETRQRRADEIIRRRMEQLLGDDTTQQR